MNQANTNQSNSQPGKISHGRSTIEFPYLDLDYAIEVATAVHAVGGTSCDQTQLGAQMRLASEGGAFRLRLVTAKMYGLITYERTIVTLTELGKRIIDPKRAEIAKAESFLTVPLYKETYERLKNSTLPPNNAIEQIIEKLGVVTKQKEKARQIFMRSAKQAGFFKIDPSRLSYPPTNGESGDHQALPPLPREESDDTKSKLHPFIEGLLKTLPQPDMEWDLTERIKWLDASSKIFNLIYKSGQNAKEDFIQITIVRKTDNDFNEKN